MGAHSMSESYWSELRRLILVIPIVAVFLSFAFGCNAVARWLGYPGESGLNVALAILSVGEMALILRREYPRQGRPLLYRMLSGVGAMFGLWMIVRSAMHVEYDRWAILSGSLHVLMAIAMILQFGWVCRRYPPPPVKPAGKPMGDWAD
jgi:hypothetical protein